MSEHYDFHYQPTGSGAISGQQVLEQTEDAINELGDYVYDNVGGAMDVAQEALETAQNAQNDAQTALDTANSFSSAIQSAQQDASTALSTAQTAQTTASNANATAIQASQDASSAVTTANNASSQVSTLSGTVTALGQRVTTAEGNIGQNTSDITALTTRVGTAEGNITTLQNDVTIAQGNASSAMATAGTVKQQSYVLRYSSTTLVASSTNSNSLLDNTDNLKVGDKVIDSSGVIYSVTAIDTANSTFTIGTSLIDLAQDSDVVHKSGNETVGGQKTFNDLQIIGYGTQYKGARNAYILPEFSAGYSGLSITTLSFVQTVKIGNYVLDANNKPSLDASKSYIQFATGENNGVNACVLEPRNSTSSSLGTSFNKWSKIYGTEYYYGANNVEFSTKFVTADTAQTISGAKTFASNAYIYNSDNTANTPNLILQSSKIQLGDTTNSDTQSIFFNAGSSFVAKVDSYKDASGTQNLQYRVRTNDTSNNIISAMYRLRLFNTGLAFLSSDIDNTIALGSTSNKWKDACTYLINGLTPSSLSMPDIANKIDISSYITDLTGVDNEYTPTVNGWICVRSGNATKISILDSATNIGNQSVSNTATYLTVMTPVIANRKVYLNVMCTSLEHAYFIPCQGNV